MAYARSQPARALAGRWCDVCVTFARSPKPVLESQPEPVRPDIFVCERRRTGANSGVRVGPVACVRGRSTVWVAADGVGRADVFRETAEPVGYRVHALDPSRDSLFTIAIPPHPPRWLDFIAPHVSGSLDGLFAASASAVLLVEAGSPLFAVTFGQGRHLLNQDSLEPDFGLRVVLNTVAPDQLKSVDARTIDETTVHTRRDVSRDSAFSAFELDPSRDLLRALTGTPEDTSLAE
jgi:uncharacterized protein (TIGR04141 family)